MNKVTEYINLTKRHMPSMHRAILQSMFLIATNIVNYCVLVFARAISSSHICILAAFPSPWVFQTKKFKKKIVCFQYLTGLFNLQICGDSLHQKDINFFKNFFICKTNNYLHYLQYSSYTTDITITLLYSLTLHYIT